MSRVIGLVKGIGALVLLALLVVGVPVLLARTAGWPLPTSVPSTDAVGDALTRTGIPESTLVKAVALVVWVAWLQLLVSVATEVVSALRHRPAARLRATVPPVRALAASLVSAVVALGTLGPAGASTSAPPPLAQVLAPTAPAAAPMVLSPAAAPEVGETSSWTVQPRDTLWRIAEVTLGSGERWREVARLNTGREVAPGVVFTGRSEELRAGWRLLLPAREPVGSATPSSFSSRPATVGGETVTVERGDTLSSLAERCYGDAAQWTTLWEANQGGRFGGRVFDDPNLIFAGWQLSVPAVDAGGGGIVADLSPVPEAPTAPARAVTAGPTSTPTATPTAAPVPVPTTALAPMPTPTPTPTPTSVAPTLATTPAPTLTTTTPAVEAGPALPGADAESSMSGWSVATGVTGATLLATGVTGLLGSRRRRRLERLAPDEALPASDPDLAPIERTLRRGADPLATARLQVSLRALAALTRRPEHADLRPVAVRRSPVGDLEFTLALPMAVVAPWTAEGDGAVWRLAAEVPLLELAKLGAGVPSPCPAMVLLGVSDGSELYLDLEAAGSVALGGRREEARAIARGVVASLAVSPLADRVHVVAAGIDCYGFANEERVHAVADDAAGLELAANLARPVQLALERHGVGSTFALRAAHPEEPWEPVVLVTPGGLESVDAARPELVERAGSGLAVLSGDPEQVTRWRLDLDGQAWRLEPVGVTVVPQGLAADELADVGALLVDAAVEPVPAGPRPPLVVTDDPFVEPAWTLLVRVLGPVDVVDASGRAVSFERAKALELAVWLAEHRLRPTRSSARAALWETDVRDATFANVVSDARRALARLVEPPVDEEWIGRTYADDLPLHPLVRTDAELLGARLGHARQQPDEAAVATLRDGLRLVRDLPFAGTSFLWPDGEALPSHHTVLVVTAAAEMATRCLTLGDVEGVFWATSQGMKALPAHDELVALRMRAHAAKGDFAGVRQEYESYERVILSDPWGDGTPSPKVAELRRGLVRPVPAH